MDEHAPAIKRSASMPGRFEAQATAEGEDEYLAGLLQKVMQAAPYFCRCASGGAENDRGDPSGRLPSGRKPWSPTLLSPAMFSIRFGRVQQRNGVQILPLFA